MQQHLHHHFRRLGLCMLLLLACAAVRAQQSVSGQITSAEDRQPVPGATVKVKGSSKGALTDANGQFVINAAAADTLLISYIGFTPAEVAVKDQQNILITLHTDKRSLDEVVVTALGLIQEFICSNPSRLTSPALGVIGK